jgi:hypothetical protein
MELGLQLGMMVGGVRDFLVTMAFACIVNDSWISFVKEKPQPTTLAPISNTNHCKVPIDLYDVIVF